MMCAAEQLNARYRRCLRQHINCSVEIALEKHYFEHTSNVRCQANQDQSMVSKNVSIDGNGVSRRHQGSRERHAHAREQSPRKFPILTLLLFLI